jgi:hypothetical protein
MTSIWDIDGVVAVSNDVGRIGDPESLGSFERSIVKPRSRLNLKLSATSKPPDEAGGGVEGPGDPEDTGEPGEA